MDGPLLTLVLWSFFFCFMYRVSHGKMSSFKRISIYDIFNHWVFTWSQSYGASFALHALRNSFCKLWNILKIWSNIQKKFSIVFHLLCCNTMSGCTIMDLEIFVQSAVWYTTGSPSLFYLFWLLCYSDNLFATYLLENVKMWHSTNNSTAKK